MAASQWQPLSGSSNVRIHSESVRSVEKGPRTVGAPRRSGRAERDDLTQDCSAAAGANCPEWYRPVPSINPRATDHMAFQPMPFQDARGSLSGTAIPFLQSGDPSPAQRSERDMIALQADSSGWNRCAAAPAFHRTYPVVGALTPWRRSAYQRVPTAVPRQHNLGQHNLGEGMLTGRIFCR